VALQVGAGPASASFPGANGKIAFVSGDPGDIHVINPDGTGRTNLTNSSAAESSPAWSPDGQKLAFVRDCQIHVMNADGTGDLQVTTFGSCKSELAWSPSGAAIAFTMFSGTSDGDGIFVMNADGTGQRLLVGDFGADGEPDWSPDGSTIVYTGNRRFDYFDGAIRTIRVDGSATTDVTHGSEPHWSADGGRISFNRYGYNDVRGIYTMKPDGSDVLFLETTQSYRDAVWSPEGGEFVMAGAVQIAVVGENGLQPRNLTADATDNRSPDWQPLPPRPTPPGYPRPLGATPLRVSLVPAFEACTAPNATHGAPLAYGSCSPPRQISPYLTVGTGDANGHTAASSSFVQYKVTPDDVGVTATVTDVLCRTADVYTCSGGALSDYTGQLEATSAIRVTDSASSHTADIPATMDHYQFPIRIPCAETASASGGSCSIETSFNTVLPGVIVAGKRAIWALSQIQIRDGGVDGAPGSDDYTTFMVQGLFVP
jgi:TolB protein